MIGETISHYRVVSKLGEGGMGVLYKAEDTRLDRTVALKFLAPHLVADEESRQRFVREAKAAASLDHPNICTVYEIDEVESKTFIAMAYIEGRNLANLIAAGPLKIPQTLDIARQVARGLHEAHVKGIVHRDIKPSNILISTTGSGESRVKITDFGLALLAGVSNLTRPGTTLGTTAYMSPEQTQGAAVDSRTDIWSMGVILYEMVTSQQPFKGHYEQAVLYSIVHEKPAPVSTVCTDVPLELERIIGKALTKDVDSRYQSALEFSLDLETLLGKLQRPGEKAEDSVRTSSVKGREWRTQTELFGLPLIHYSTAVNQGTGSRRVAKGIIAIGHIALGVVAVGTQAAGAVVAGVLSAGLVTVGGAAVGIVSSLGLIAIGGHPWGWLSVPVPPATAVVLAIFGTVLARMLISRQQFLGESPGSTFSIWAIFGGREWRSDGTPFRGGSVISTFGGCDIDLTDTQVSGAEAVVEAIALFGGVKIIVAPGMRVVTRGAQLFGGYANKTRPPKADASVASQHLLVKGFALFGAVEITNPKPAKLEGNADRTDT